MHLKKIHHLNSKITPMKFVFSFLLFCLMHGLTFSQAQAFERIVGLAAISYSPRTCNQESATSLYNYILTAMQQTNRFRMIDHVIGHQAIVKEKDLQTGEDFVEGDVVEQGKRNGAHYLVFVHVNSADAITLMNKKTNEISGYEGNLSLFIRTFDLKTGEFTASDIITPKRIEELSEFQYADEAGQAVSNILGKLGGGPAATPEEAISQSIQKIESNIRKYIDVLFPLEMKIADIQDEPNPKNEKKIEKEVLIKGGKATGLKKGDVLEVREMLVRKLKGTGEEIPDEVAIGKLKVLRVRNALVVCKITEEAEKILQTFSKKPDNLKVLYLKSNPFEL